MSHSLSLVCRCTYDYLELSETDQSQVDVQKLSLGQLSLSSPSSTLSMSTASAVAWYNKVVHKVFNRNSSSSTATAAFNPALITAQLLNSDANGGGGGSNMDSPTHTGNSDRAWESFNRIASAVPRRMCGDWSPKLKLLRYVTKKPGLLFHFASDYSHQSGGYKAKVSIENGE